MQREQLQIAELAAEKAERQTCPSVGEISESELHSWLESGEATLQPRIRLDLPCFHSAQQTRRLVNSDGKHVDRDQLGHSHYRLRWRSAG
jgi:hypothetical protein